VPFPLLCGEAVEYLGRTAAGVIALSNFRLLIRSKDSFINVPLGMVESIECREIFFLNIYCKDATVVTLDTLQLHHRAGERAHEVIHPHKLETFSGIVLTSVCTPYWLVRQLMPVINKEIMC
jgi:hypothetical protein